MPELRSLIGLAPTWGLSFEEVGAVSTGPLASFGDNPPALTVTLVGRRDIPEGIEKQSTTIREWSGESKLVNYEFPEMSGIRHEGGGNWILWTDDLAHVFVSESGSLAQDWVHVRFVIRHFAACTLTSRPGHRQMHAVAATLSGTRKVALIAGPTGSGKTTLMNRLIREGLLGECIEDDCVVIDPSWQAWSLMPLEREYRRSTTSKIALLVGLEPALRVATPPEANKVVAQAFHWPASWPASWLPSFNRPSFEVPAASEEVVCASLPFRAGDDPATLARLESLIDQASSKARAR